MPRIITKDSEQEPTAYVSSTNGLTGVAVSPRPPYRPPVSTEEPESRVRTRLNLVSDHDVLGQERVLGANDLMSVNYLAAGYAAARSVCRIHMRSADGTAKGYGTGFLVAPNLLLTNHHVLPTAGAAAQSFVEFNYEYDTSFMLKDTEKYRLDPNGFFYSDESLDFALVRVEAASSRGAPIADHGHFSLIAQTGKALIGEHVTILQHPHGEHKQIALRSNRILGLVDDYIHYETDTLPGSSGSPVLNDQWQVVALHRAGVARRDSAGRILTRDGKLWKPEMGDDAVDWIANEGTRISAICTHLRAASAKHDAIRDILGEIMPNSLEEAAAEGSDNTGGEMRPTVTIAAIALDDAPPPVITKAEFDRLLADPETTAADLAPYVVLDVELSGAFNPTFRLNRERVIDTSGQEGDVLVAGMNYWEKRNRHKAYRQRLAENPNAVRIISEGDSWFQFPLLVEDVIDYLMQDRNLAVLSHGAAGDLLSDMLGEREYLSALESEAPAFFLISGGGNDLVGNGRLATVIHPFSPDRAPEQYLNGEFAALEGQLRDLYRHLFSQLNQQFPGLTTICHGYDYVIPDAGKWLGKPLGQQGITDKLLQRQILRVIIDRFNDVIARVAQEYDSVVYLDLRETVSDDEWFDELHPNNEGFRKVAQRFAALIRALG